MAEKDITKLKRFCEKLSECYTKAVYAKVEIELAESDGSSYLMGQGQVWYMIYIHIDGDQAIAYKSTHYIPEDVMQDILMLSHAVVMREYMGIDEVM